MRRNVAGASKAACLAVAALIGTRGAREGLEGEVQSWVDFQEKCLVVFSTKLCEFMMMKNKKL